MTEETKLTAVKVINVHRGPVFINGKYLKVGQEAKLKFDTAMDLIEKGYVKQVK